MIMQHLSWLIDGEVCCCHVQRVKNLGHYAHVQTAYTRPLLRERGLGMRLIVSLLWVYGTLKQPKQPEIRKKLGIYPVLGDIKSTQSRYVDTSNVMISLNIDVVSRIKHALIM